MRVALFSLYLPSFLFPQFFVTYRERETTAPSPSNLSVTRPTHYTPWADDHVKVVSCHHSLSHWFYSESKREISSSWHHCRASHGKHSPTNYLWASEIWMWYCCVVKTRLLNERFLEQTTPKVQGTSAVSQYFINPHSFIVTVARSSAFSGNITVSVHPSSQRGFG